MFRAKLGHMKLHPRVSKSALELVKRFEGLRRRAARLPDGGWTLGYGHTLTAREGAEVTPEEAELLLYYDLSEVATRIDAWTFTPLNQNQFEALVAFAFNIGIENFRRSTVLKRINEGQHLQAAAAMELWRKTEVGGEAVVADALVRRRAAEKAHYLTPPEGFQPSPSQVLRPTFDHAVIEVAAHSLAAHRAQGADASLERPAEPRPIKAAAPDPIVPAPHEETPLPNTVPFEDIAGAAPIAAAMATPLLRAPDPVSDGRRTQASEAEPASALAAFPLFEAPHRFAPADDALPPAANEHLPAVFEVPEASQHPGDFNEFDRPLAAPQPIAPQSIVQPGLAYGDEEARAAIKAPRPSRSASALQDRTVLFSAIGLLGVSLFTLAILTMLVGKPTLWHLVIGSLGVVLITPAGIFFLMQRMGKTPDRHD